MILTETRANNLLQKFVIKHCKEILQQVTRILQIHEEKK